MAQNLLTDKKIRNFKPGAEPQRYSDGGGLYLYIPAKTDKGSVACRWKYRYVDDETGKQVWYKGEIGFYPDMTLAEARRKRDELRRLGNPNKVLEEEKRQKPIVEIKTFGEVAELWFDDWEKIVSPNTIEKEYQRLNAHIRTHENYKKLKKRSDQIRVRIGWLDGFWTSLKESQCGSCRFLSESLFDYVCFYYPPHPCASRVPVTHGIPVEYWNNRKQCPRRKPPGLAASHHLSDFALKWLPRIRQLFSLRLRYEFETEMLLLGFPHDLVQTASGEIPGVQILKKTEDLTFLTSAIFAYQKKWKKHERSDPEWLSAALSRLIDLTAPAVERDKCGNTPESAGI